MLSPGSPAGKVHQVGAISSEPEVPGVGAAAPADPFDLPVDFDAPSIPRIDPMTPAPQRRALVDELRGLVDRGEYRVDTDVVALAVMNADGLFVPPDEG